MAIIVNKTFDEERALYGQSDIAVIDCRFDGPADGESAFKECRKVEVRDCYFNLRYPFWHNTDLEIVDCDFTGLCRAALWYSKNITIRDSRLYGIKALRECENTVIKDSDIISPEFGWMTQNTSMKATKAESEYFMFRSKNLNFNDVTLKGKYSFQYIENSTFTDCHFDTKDAFWHAKNVKVTNSVISGEYLAWYCEDVTFENCVISGTQPLCYCKGLKLINCVMKNTDLCFEKSEADAIIRSDVISIKNPKSGTIKVKSLGELILDEPDAKGKVIVTG